MTSLEQIVTAAYVVSAGWLLWHVSVYRPDESRLVRFIDRHTWRPIRSFVGRRLGGDALNVWLARRQQGR